MRFYVLAAAVMMALAVCGCKGEKEDAAVKAARELGTATENPVVATDSGLRYIAVKQGEGDAAKAGDSVTVHYTGWLVNGEKFDSSVDRGQPFEFPLGGGRVIKGWDLGVAGMKVGGVRKLIIPPNLGYGSRGTGPIPPDSTLIFEVELLGAE
jgi:FKBP-type peptidyl-prolyl cis-trans isomerase